MHFDHQGTHKKDNQQQLPHDCHNHNNSNQHKSKHQNQSTNQTIQISTQHKHQKPTKQLYNAPEPLITILRTL